MNHLKENGFKLSNIYELSYPGSCGQCDMKKRGIDTISFQLTPDRVLKFCNVCYTEQKSKIEVFLQRIKDEKIYFEKSFCIPDGLFYDDGWEICEDYKIYFVEKEKTMIPCIKDAIIRWVDKDDLIFLNN